MFLKQREIKKGGKERGNTGNWYKWKEVDSKMDNQKPLFVVLNP
jgi:hypothetical protein